MTTTMIDRSGASQSVQLPDGFKFDVDEVVLHKKRANLREAFDLLASMPDDYFVEGRQDRHPAVREAL